MLDWKTTGAALALASLAAMAACSGDSFESSDAGGAVGSGTAGNATGGVGPGSGGDGAGGMAVGGGTVIGGTLNGGDGAGGDGAGGDGAGGDGAGGDGAGCEDGATRCMDQELLTCADGAFATTETCEFTCIDGACTDCLPNDRSCDGTDRLVCTPGGQWTILQGCSGGCVGGACTDCTPGETTCDGLQPQTCSDAGAFEDAGDRCEFLCDEETGCYGECSPGARDCGATPSPLNAPRACSTSGDWEEQSPCVNQACVGGACQGVCLPGTARCNGTVIQDCDNSGTWVNRSDCPTDSPATPRCYDPDGASGDTAPTCVCQTGATRCTSTTTVVTCLDDGTETAERACDSCNMTSNVCSQDLIVCTYAYNDEFRSNTEFTVTCAGQTAVVQNHNGNNAVTNGCRDEDTISCPEGAAITWDCDDGGGDDTMTMSLGPTRLSSPDVALTGGTTMPLETTYATCHLNRD